MHEIHPTAIVEAGAQLGTRVSIGAFSLIRANAIIGANSTIGSHCVIGEGNDEPLLVGSDSVVRSHNVIYGGSEIGGSLETGHAVIIRESMRIGDGVRVGTNSDLQGHATIGHFVRLHSGVQVNHGTVIEDFAWLFPYVVLTNDPHPPSDGATIGPVIGRAAAVGARSLVLPGIRIGAGSLVAAGSTVTRNVDDGRIVMGVPARDVGTTESIRWRGGGDERPYPWWNHFRRGYPATVRWTDDGPVYDRVT